MNLSDWYFCYCKEAPADEDGHSAHCLAMNPDVSDPAVSFVPTDLSPVTIGPAGTT